MAHERNTSDRSRLLSLERQLRAESSDSRALVESLTDNPVCMVQIDASVPCITLVWKGYATSSQLRYVHEKVLELLEIHGLRAVLGDDTALAALHAEDQRWIVDDWMARATAAGLIAAANRRSRMPWANVAIESVQSLMSKHVEVRSFDDWEAARSWLRTVADVRTGFVPLATPEHGVRDTDD